MSDRGPCLGAFALAVLSTSLQEREKEREINNTTAKHVNMLTIGYSVKAVKGTVQSALVISLSPLSLSLSAPILTYHLSLNNLITDSVPYV